MLQGDNKNINDFDQVEMEAEGSEIYVGENGTYKPVKEDMFIRVGGGYMELERYI